MLAQIFFGVAIGLIYYSSLFYSMDASEAKGEHGGIHEAAIGVGNCIGPAVGAASLQFLPQYANSGAIAVSALLLLRPRRAGGDLENRPVNSKDKTSNIER